MAYASKYPDQLGRFTYSTDDNAVWNELFTRQMSFLENRICDEFLEGIDLLDLKPDAVPQVTDVNTRLNALTDFGVEGVPAIIPPSKFYALLADRKFPVATFLRTREDMDYIEEPDIFHEVFGHCPLLTNRAYTDFVEHFGQRAIDLGKGYSWHLFRLFWYTVEFGMIETPHGLRGYGAGIASSPSEAEFACSGKAHYQPADLLTMLRTPYRIDIVQPQYFVIESFDALRALLDTDIKAAVDQAKDMGNLPVLFEAAA